MSVSKPKIWLSDIGKRGGGGVGRFREDAFKESGEASGWERTRKDRKLLDSSANRRVRMLAIEAAKKKVSKFYSLIDNKIRIRHTLHCTLKSRGPSQCQAIGASGVCQGELQLILGPVRGSVELTLFPFSSPSSIPRRLTRDRQSEQNKMIQWNPKYTWNSPQIV